MFALSKSTQFDWRLAPYDIAGSRAHARPCIGPELLTDAELAGMLLGLDRLDRRGGVRRLRLRPRPTRTCMARWSAD